MTMRIKTLKGSAAGRSFALTLTAPVAVLVGPTGRGKSTLLRLAEWGATGALRGDTGVPITMGRLIHERLGAGLGAVSAEVVLDTPLGSLHIERVVEASERDGKKTCSSTVVASCGQWRAKNAAAQAELDDRIGRPVVLDAIFAGTAIEARRALIDTCSRHAPPWTADQVGDEPRAEIVRVIEARWPDDLDRPPPSSVLRAAGSPTGGPSILDGAMAASEACHDRLKSITADLKAAEHAAAQTTDVALAVEQRSAEELAAMRAEVASLEAQIEQSAAAIRAATDTARQVQDLDRRIAALAEQHAALPAAEARTVRARAALDAATERLLTLEQEPVLVIPDAIDQTAERDELRVVGHPARLVVHQHRRRHAVVGSRGVQLLQRVGVHGSFMPCA